MWCWFDGSMFSLPFQCLSVGRDSLWWCYRLLISSSCLTVVSVLIINLWAIVWQHLCLLCFSSFQSVHLGVICLFQKLAAECQSAGYSGTLIPYKCDVSNEEEILSMFSAIKTLHKGVDVCINNAGLAHNEPLLSGKTEGWRNMIDVGGCTLWQKQTVKKCRVYIFS